MTILWLNSLNYCVLVIMAANDTFNSRGYTDRKKKIIREWNKTNSSPRCASFAMISPFWKLFYTICHLRPAETLTSDPLRPSYMVR